MDNLFSKPKKQPNPLKNQPDFFARLSAHGWQEVTKWDLYQKGHWLIQFKDDKLYAKTDPGATGFPIPTQITEMQGEWVIFAVEYLCRQTDLVEELFSTKDWEWKDTQDDTKTEKPKSTNKKPPGKRSSRGTAKASRSHR